MDFYKEKLWSNISVSLFLFPSVETVFRFLESIMPSERSKNYKFWIKFSEVLTMVEKKTAESVEEQNYFVRTWNVKISSTTVSAKGVWSGPGTWKARCSQTKALCLGTSAMSLCWPGVIFVLQLTSRHCLYFGKAKIKFLASVFRDWKQKAGFMWVPVTRHWHLFWLSQLSIKQQHPYLLGIEKLFVWWNFRRLLWGFCFVFFESKWKLSCHGTSFHNSPRNFLYSFPGHPLHFSHMLS